MVHFDTSVIDAIPDPGPIEASWGICRSRISTADSEIESATTTWLTLIDQLVLPPDMAELYLAFDPAKRLGNGLEKQAARVERGMDGFVGSLEGFVTRREQIHADIVTFQSKYPADRELDFFETIGRNWASSNIKGDILNLQRDYAEAEDRLISYLDAYPPKKVDSLPIHFPGGGDAFDQSMATAIANRLLDGTSDDPAGDYQRLLDLLDGLTPEQIEELAGLNPRLPLVMPPQGVDPEANRAWWDSLTDAQRAALTEHVSGLVGNMEGLTYADRTAANVINLERMNDRASEQENGTRDWGLTEHQIQGYRKLQEVYEWYSSSELGSQIASFDPNDNPKAAVVFGNLDTADHQTYYVPGMGGLLLNIDGAAADARQILREQQRLMGDGEETAVVVWAGYDAPPFIGYDANTGEYLNTDVIRNEHAREGGSRLRYALEGLNTANGHTSEADRNISVVAFSYGTPTSAYALADINFEVDQAVFYGSVGMPRDAAMTSSDLNIERDASGEVRLYAATAEGDWPARTAVAGTKTPVSLLSGERIDPTSGPFESKVFSVQGNGEVPGKPTYGHAGVGDGGSQAWSVETGYGYLDDGTQGLRSIGLITLERGDEVPTYQEAEYHERWARWGSWPFEGGSPYTNPPMK